MSQTASVETPKEMPKDATASVIAQHAATLKALPFSDVRDFDDAASGFLGTIENAKVTSPGALRVPVGGAGARDRRSQPVAAIAAEHASRPVRGRAWRLSGARPRHRQHDVDQGRARRYRRGHADLDRGGAGCDGPVLPAPRQEVGYGGELHPYSHRPLGRGARRTRRRRAGLRPGADYRSQSLHGACGLRKHYRGSIAGSASRWRRGRWRCCVRPT